MSEEQQNNENEANVDLKGVIKDLAEQIDKLTKIVEKSSKQIKANTSANTDWHKYQALMRIEQEKEHGRQVRLNKEYGRTEASLQMFTGLLTKGAGAGFVFNKLANTIGGVSKELDKFKQETAELSKLQKKYAGLDLSKPENIAEHDILKAQEARVGTAKEEMDEKKGGSGKLAEGISSMKAFAEKHKTGILIGAGSVGILLTVLKKAFDVSPMFQAIKKLLQFGFMLILRPIGDFFGFIMRPIMVMMLRKFIIPWYKDVYPAMKKWGTYIGEKLVPVMEAILAFLTAGGGAGLAAAGGAVVAGTVAANIIMAKKIMAALGGGGTQVTKVTTSLSSKITTGFKNVGTTIKTLFTHPKQIISQVTKNISTSLKNVTTSVKSSIMAVRTTLATSTTKITSFVGKMGTTLGTKVGKIIPQITKGFTSLGTSISGLSKGVTSAFGNLGKSLGSIGKNLNISRLLTKVGKGGGIASIGMLLEGMFASPETLGGILDEDSDYRLDKGLKYLASGGQTGLGGFSEDESGKFQTIGYGNELADMMGDESWKHGFINKAFSGEATGTGGGAGDARARTVIINVDHINNDMDLKHVGDYFSEKLQEDNKKTAET